MQFILLFTLFLLVNSSGISPLCLFNCPTIPNSFPNVNIISDTYNYWIYLAVNYNTGSGITPFAFDITDARLWEGVPIQLWNYNATANHFFMPWYVNSQNHFYINTMLNRNLCLEWNGITVITQTCKVKTAQQWTTEYSFGGDLSSICSVNGINLGKISNNANSNACLNYGTYSIENSTFVARGNTLIPRIRDNLGLSTCTNAPTWRAYCLFKQ